MTPTLQTRRTCKTHGTWLNDTFPHVAIRCCLQSMLKGRVSVIWHLWNLIEQYWTSHILSHSLPILASCCVYGMMFAVLQALTRHAGPCSVGAMSSGCKPLTWDMLRYGCGSQWVLKYPPGGCIKMCIRQKTNAIFRFLSNSFWSNAGHTENDSILNKELH